MDCDQTIINLSIEALETDSSHHKQWYLEQILKVLVSDKKFEELKYKWEEGIAP